MQDYDFLEGGRTTCILEGASHEYFLESLALGSTGANYKPRLDIAEIQYKYPEGQYGVIAIR